MDDINAGYERLAELQVKHSLLLLLHSLLKKDSEMTPFNHIPLCFRENFGPFCYR